MTLTARPIKKSLSLLFSHSLNSFILIITLLLGRTGLLGSGFRYIFLEQSLNGPVYMYIYICLSHMCYMRLIFELCCCASNRIQLFIHSTKNGLDNSLLLWVVSQVSWVSKNGDSSEVLHFLIYCKFRVQ